MERIFGREGEAGVSGASASGASASGAASLDSSRPYARATTARTVRELFGLNEGLGVPDVLVRRYGWSSQERDQIIAQRVAQAVALGVSHYRIHTFSYPACSWYEMRQRPGSQDRLDRFVRLVQSGGLDVILMLGPWPGNRPNLVTDRYVPSDMDDYQRWVREIVERYDGDGHNDAPDLLRPIYYWEVDNEPDVHFHKPYPNPGQDLSPGEFETPSEYVQVFEATASGIREASPGAYILNGGTFDSSQPEGSQYLRQVLAAPGVAKDLNILSFHAYFEDRDGHRFDQGMENIERMRGDRPLWLTETGVPSVRPGRPEIDQVYQARMLALVFGEAMNRGIERIFWHSLADPMSNLRGQEPDKQRGFTTHSLLQAVSEDPPSFQRKPVGELYARLATLLGQEPVSSIERVQVSRGRCVRVGAAGWFVYKGQGVSVPGASGTVVQLLDGSRVPYQGEVDAPALIQADPQ